MIVAATSSYIASAAVATSLSAATATTVASAADVVGVFGGTFDPIHLGHLHIARAILEQAHLQSLRLIPCYQSPHRVLPLASAAHRVAMLELALAEMNDLRMVVDACEANKAQLSYAVDTLEALHAELSAVKPVQHLCLIVGMDVFLKFTLWRNWRRIVELCHIIVAPRAGMEDSNKLNDGELVDGELATAFTVVTQPKALRERAAGCVWFAKFAPLAIAATTIRQMIKDGRGEEAATLLPSAVWQYIKRHGLYR